MAAGVSRGLLFPDLEPEAIAEGWLPEVPPMTSYQILDALASRHPMDGYNGPGRWVYVREVMETTGAYADCQRFDAVAIGLVPSVKYARVIYEVKVSRADWLRELKPKLRLRRPDGGWEPIASHEQGQRLIASRVSRWWDGAAIEEYAKWDAAVSLSTEFWIAAPPRVVQIHELPPEAGLVEIRPYGEGLRPKVVRPAPVRDTANPDAGFWASVLRRAAVLRTPGSGAA